MSKKSILGFLQLNVLGGASFLFFSKGYFVISSYFIYSSLPRLLPKEEVGIYFVVNSIVAVINAIFVIGTIQTVSKFVSEAPEKGRRVVTAAARLQAILAGGVCAVFFVSAPLIAAGLNDPSLTSAIRVSAAIPPSAKSRLPGILPRFPDRYSVLPARTADENGKSSPSMPGINK